MVATIDINSFPVKVFVGNIAEEISMSYNFTYYYDLRPVPGRRVMEIHSGTGGSQLPRPVSVPYGLKGTP